MSEPRCKSFKCSQSKSYTESIRNNILSELHKKRKDLIANLRAV